ncbi:hypothetical protein Cgig2_032974 [Carnegiea gigantea]|uniref:Uncharacterized protein n=1 Tax=Carnegiea gigantea TaxID=171969 RepID=A0A9Q1GKJ5_9CARY|nr:hypothetical protein Cgig2_002915 [Carnegiea gigantea]KAJ8420972.1 hypothetical protein Cgig2_032974 [Carnegiea gigantea]
MVRRYLCSLQRYTHKPLYASLFLYDRCSGLIRVVCDYWCLETNTLDTSKLHLYNEVPPNQWELTNKLPPSCTYLFTAYHKLMKVVIFNELGVAKGQCNKIFLGVFLSYWLCTFILLVGEAGCIPSGTLNITTFMALVVGYCLSTTILTSIYEGLNEISHSLYPRRGGGHFRAHFLHACLTKNFDTSKLDGEASSSPGMVKFSGLGQTKSFKLKESREFISSGRGFACIHPSSTDLMRLSIMLSWSTTALIDLVDNLISIRRLLLIWTSIIFLTQKQCFAVTISSHAIEQGPKYYLVGDAIYFREIPLVPMTPKKTK